MGVIGEAADLTYDYTHLGSAAKDIAKAAKAPFLAAMAKAKRPMIVVGPGVMRRADSKAVMKDILSLATSAGAGRSCHLSAFGIPAMLMIWACIVCACTKLVCACTKLSCHLEDPTGIR